MGQVLPTKEGHENLGKRQKTFIKAFQRGFPAYGVANDHHHKINGVIHTKAGSGELHLLLNGCKYSGLFDDVGHRSHFFHPCWK